MYATSSKILKMTPSWHNVADITMALIYVNKDCVNQKKYTCRMCVCTCNNVKRKASCDQQTEGRVI